MNTLGFIGGVSGGEMLLVFAIALLMFGAKRLPGLARQLGRSVEQFRRAAQQVREEFINADRDIERAAEAEPAPPPAPAPEPYDPARAEVGPAPADGLTLAAESGTATEEPAAAATGEPPAPAAPSREGEHRGGEGI